MSDHEFPLIGEIDLDCEHTIEIYDFGNAIHLDVYFNGGESETYMYDDEVRQLVAVLQKWLSDYDKDSP